MTAAIALKETTNSEIIEGIIEGEQNQNALSQRQADLFVEDVCEFNSDEEIIADWLQSKSHQTAKTYYYVVANASTKMSGLICGNHHE